MKDFLGIRYISDRQMGRRERDPAAGGNWLEQRNSTRRGIQKNPRVYVGGRNLDFSSALVSLPKDIASIVTSRNALS